MIFIHQIGNVVIPFEASSVAPLKLDMERNFRGDANQPAGGVTTVLTQYRGLPEPKKITLNATLVSQDGRSASAQLNDLLSLGGVPYIDVIGYVPDIAVDCGAQAPSFPVQWLMTTGMITRITPTTEVNGKGVHPAEALEVSIDLLLDPFWYPIDKFQFQVQYGSLEATLFTPVTLLEYDPQRLPRAPGRFVFRRKNYLNWYTGYTPQVWTTDYYTADSFKVSPLQVLDYSYQVAPDRSRWGAPPTAVYALSNLPTTGTLTIQVESEYSPGRLLTHESTLDLGALSTRLADDYDLGGILPGDVLIVSDSLHAPGFLLRDDTPLTFNDRLVKPEWVYPYESPGQLIGSRQHGALPGAERRRRESRLAPRLQDALMITAKFYDLEGRFLDSFTVLSLTVERELNAVPTFDFSIDSTFLHGGSLDRQHQPRAAIDVDGVREIDGYVRSISLDESGNYRVQCDSLFVELTRVRSKSNAKYQDQQVVAILLDLLTYAPQWALGDFLTMEDFMVRTTVDLRGEKRLFSQITKLMASVPNLFFREGPNRTIELGIFDRQQQPLIPRHAGPSRWRWRRSTRT